MRPGPAGFPDSHLPLDKIQEVGTLEYYFDQMQWSKLHLSFTLPLRDLATRTSSSLIALLNGHYTRSSIVGFIVLVDLVRAGLQN